MMILIPINFKVNAAPTYINSEDFINTIHIIKAVYNLPDHCIYPRTQPATCYNTSLHFIWSKINLCIMEKVRWNCIQVNILHLWRKRKYLLTWSCSSKMYPSWRVLVNNNLQRDQQTELITFENGWNPYKVRRITSSDFSESKLKYMVAWDMNP